MSYIEKLSKFESVLRPVLVNNSSLKTISFYSNQKKIFLKKFIEDYKNFDPINISKRTKIWEIEFNLPIFNAAGMFKTGKGYYTVAKQGAGAWLVGTTTGEKRMGNFKNGILHPFISLPKSGASINWMGLPNESHEVVAKRISELNKVPYCPIGVSLSYDANLDFDSSIDNLINGLNLYEKAGVDFIEINESCPNVEEHHLDSKNRLDEELIKRIELINNLFIKKLNRNIPIIIKLSNDTNINLISEVLDLLIENNFTGLNFGNTSTEYDTIRNSIKPNEQKLFDLFTKEFGGGVSGKPLKNISLELCKKSLESLKTKKIKREFAIIRTGGIENSQDIQESINWGINLNQWYNFYFSNFSKFGHNIYKEIFAGI